LLVFHGGDETVASIRSLTRFDDYADRFGYIVAYPVALGGTWNAADVDLARRVIADVRAAYPVDGRRIVATGFAAGGTFAQRLGCELPELAGIVSVDGNITSDGARACRPPHPLNTILMFGTADPVFNFDGSPTHLSAKADVAMWVDRNRCHYSSTGVESPLVATDPTSVQRTLAYACLRGVTTAFYQLTGAGHVWPFRDPPSPNSGPPTLQLDASDLVSQFLVSGGATT
jgi:polyhydroxybutyrate depolymerase